MEKIIESIIILVSQIIVVGVSYNLGWEKREKQFQDNPIIFTEGVENAVKIYREKSGIKVKIYKEKLVEIIK